MRVDTTKILTTEEIKTVVAYLKSKRRYINNRQALIVFRLACCCGLRASEVCGLTLDDIRTEGKRPHLRVRKTVGKGGKARKVPLWWDQGTLDDLRAWRREQVERGAKLFVCAQSVDSFGNPLDRRTIRRIFKRCCDVLEGRDDATVHDGRHSFVSLALAGGRSLAEVRDAAGHASIATTSIYTHVVPDDGSIGGLFA